jgi:hypothetical protein
MGHLRLISDRNWICPNAPTVRVVTLNGIAVPDMMGYCCPSGHVCLQGKRHRFWRDDRVTDRQANFLRVLGHHYPWPANKGEAHDLLERLLGDASKPVTPVARAIRLKERE